MDITHQLNSLMKDLLDSEARVSELQGQLDDHPIMQAIRSEQERANETKALLQNLMKGQTGVTETVYGKVGYQQRRTVTFLPRSVRQHAPSLAELVISETVDGKALRDTVKAAVKNGKLPANVMELLEAESQVKVVNAWICQPAEPVADRIEASHIAAGTL